jgi:hypothetical protein
LRIVQIRDDDLWTCDLGNFNAMFDEIETGPLAHRLRGRVALTFPAVDSDPRPNYLIPECRAFLAAVHESRPHFFYYLTPQTEAGLVALHLAALLPLDLVPAMLGEADADCLPPKEYLAFLLSHLWPAVAFCHGLGDDADDFVRQLAANFPAAFREALVTVVGQMRREYLPE